MTQIIVSILLVVLLTTVGSRLRSIKGRQILLLAASYLFYANWGVGFLCILIAMSLINYACGYALRRDPTTPRLWIGILLNLLPLAFFKYLPPLLELAPASSCKSTRVLPPKMGPFHHCDAHYSGSILGCRPDHEQSRLYSKNSG